MAILQEVRDALTPVADGINHIKTISEAIRSGRDYLKTTHPHVANDLAAMCEEMRKSSQALAAASSIVTHFRFVIGDALAAEGSRFNDHLVDHKTQAESLERQLDSMRGHCSVIAAHAAAISQTAQPRGLTSIAAALGLHSAERERQLADALQGIHDEEMEYHQNVWCMADAVKKALKAVQDTLGPPGIIDPKQVPAAAVVLGEYAEEFERLEADCNYNALQLQASIDVLRAV